jgi:hypothetical protein
MNKNFYITLSIITALIGVITYAYLNELFVVYFAYPKNNISIATQKNQTTKKTIDLFFWNKTEIQKEVSDIIWQNDREKDLSTIIQQVLLAMIDEKVTDDKISLQSAQFSPSGNELYLSFDKPLFNNKFSIHDKIMIVESLLKTIRENTNFKGVVHLLVNHQPLVDDHLDCSTTISIEGFCK